MSHFLSKAVKSRKMTRPQAKEVLDIHRDLRRHGIAVKTGQLAVGRSFLVDEDEANTIAKSDVECDDLFLGKAKTPADAPGPIQRHLLRVVIAVAAIASFVYCYFQWFDPQSDWYRFLPMTWTVVWGFADAVVVPCHTWIGRLRIWAWDLLMAGWAVLATKISIQWFLDPTQIKTAELLVAVGIGSCFCALSTWRLYANSRWLNMLRLQVQLSAASGASPKTIESVLDVVAKCARMHPTRSLQRAFFFFRPPIVSCYYFVPGEDSAVSVKGTAVDGTGEQVSAVQAFARDINEQRMLKKYDGPRFDKAIANRVAEMKKATAGAAEPSKADRHAKRRTHRLAALTIADRFSYVSTAGFVIASNKAIHAQNAKTCPTWNDECIAEHFGTENPTPERRRALAIRCFSFVPVRDSRGRCIGALALFSTMRNSAFPEDRTTLVLAAQAIGRTIANGASPGLTQQPKISSHDQKREPGVGPR